MKKAYTASSLKRALENIRDNSGVLIEKSELDALKCPIANERPSNSIEPCHGRPEGCQKAQFQICQRTVKVRVNDNMRFCWTITARFTISDTNYDGFVEKDDRTINWLISNKKLINADDLEAVEV